MPPWLAAAEMLASPVAKTRMPHASDRPTLGLVMAVPVATGPFMLRVTGAVTGPWATAAQPWIRPAQANATIRLLSMDVLLLRSPGAAISRTYGASEMGSATTNVAPRPRP